MVSNLLKRWRDDFATVKKQIDGFGAYRKETGCHPASSRLTSSTVYNAIIYFIEPMLANSYCPRVYTDQSYGLRQRYVFPTFATAKNNFKPVTI
jgi:hypothetical protein